LPLHLASKRHSSQLYSVFFVDARSGYTQCPSSWSISLSFVSSILALSLFLKLVLLTCPKALSQFALEIRVHKGEPILRHCSGYTHVPLFLLALLGFFSLSCLSFSCFLV
jgi:hypothetical protein